MNSQLTQGLGDYNNLSALQSLKTGSKSRAVAEVARQFESIFVNMMLKTMREATRSLNPNDEFSSDQSRFYEDMSDQQLALHLSEHGGIGLAHILQRQLSGGLAPTESAPTESKSTPTSSLRSAPVTPASRHAVTPADKQAFLDNILPHARAAAHQLGISVRVILAQAALETGWGKSLAQGFNNLFGIKADSGWKGASARHSTLELVNGQLQRCHANFRAYPSIAASVQDYVSFLQSNPRYRQALAAGNNEQAFVQALSKAGYASDPHYADKLRQIMASDSLAGQG